MKKVSLPVWILFWSLLTFTVEGCKKETGHIGSLTLSNVFIGETEVDLDNPGENTDIPMDRSISLVFSGPVDQQSAKSAISLRYESGEVPVQLAFVAQGAQVLIYPERLLSPNTRYILELSDGLKATDGAPFSARNIQFTTRKSDIEILGIEYNGEERDNSNLLTNIPLDFSIDIHLSVAVSTASVGEAFKLIGPDTEQVAFSLLNNGKTISLHSNQPLPYLTKYILTLSDALTGRDGEKFAGISKTLYTAIDPTPKFPVVSDDELLTLVQRQTFKYFWDFAHPGSGMARERNTSGNTVTSGGSGFGIMALIVGMERNFISRAQGLERMEQLLTFLETTDRFHGAWSHWIHGETGAALPFSANDNGGDLVETALLLQGLLTFRQYLNPNVPAEKSHIDRINILWESVDWNWYCRDGQEVLYWHWSPDKKWAMNLKISGWNESLITYVLAASSPTHNISKSVYTNGWARNGNMRNGAMYEGISLPLGPDFGGPLFFSHYSFLGIDPHQVQDEYANYWEQNVNHSLINHRYCVRNPKAFVGYSADCWGLTASDNHIGYAAHSPTNDLGVITPTAALSSFPYTPAESMRALHFFYYTMGDRLWGEYGFYDAFNITEGWVADSYLAIDQGPIILMIENYRTGLLWDLLMSAPEIQQGLNRLSLHK
ncbi:glucoamylase family protein [Sphingobacterium corticibacterium]|uniref:Beta-glucosidase n=1 Tax=Sphingobacterium corticibacterium TaxID=2484746 RepID=A0A4Q6XYY0_9SPHI|nr:glucoamylase family protein [Sphingobacterium corticibacterium]RZF61786.1 hypothetical protein EWE74_02840 [Sphingobacterium corticibacterium]